MPEMINRRRALAIFGATGALGIAGIPAAARARYRWQGTALGADASITIDGLDRPAAQSAVAGARDEIERLERIFSLYRPDSELSRLNAAGHLDGASHEFRLLLDRSLSYWQSTGGAFNPAIQPLWRHLADHFATDPTSPGPDPERVAAILSLCDPSAIECRGARVALAPGMALTFNGIAQGFITDAVAGQFIDAGLTGILVDLGEIRALPGRAWRIGVAGGHRTLTIRERAVATSAGSGTLLSPDGHWTHLIDPRSGRCPHHFASVTVTAATATEADALSTALFVLPPQEHDAVLERFRGARRVDAPITQAEAPR